MRLRRFNLALLLVAALGTTPASGRTGQAYVDSVSLRRGGHSDLLLSFRVKQAFDRRVMETLDAGLPVRFSFSLLVVRPREIARDEIITEVRLDRTLVKDNLKNRFRVSLGGAEDRDLATFAEAEEVMSRVDGVRVPVPEAAVRSGTAVLKIKAKLQKFQLPFHLHYLLAFVSFWDVETDWYAIELPRNLDTLP